MLDLISAGERKKKELKKKQKKTGLYLIQILNLTRKAY